MAICARARPASRRASTSAKSSRPRQPLGQLDRVGDRRRRQQEPRARSRRRRRPAAAAAGRWRRESRRPRGRRAPRRRRPTARLAKKSPHARVVGQDPDVQHVGVGQHQVRAPADRSALLALGVAVVDRRAHVLAQAERRDARAPGPGRAPWSGTGTARAPWRRRTGRPARQVEAQRLARRGAGGDDERPVGSGVQRARLVGVQRIDARLGQPVPQAGCRSSGTGLVTADRAPSNASRTSRSSARPASRRAVQGQVSGATAIGPRR